MLIIRNALLIVFLLSQLSVVFGQPSDYDIDATYSIDEMAIENQITYFSLIDNNKGIRPPEDNSWISLEDYFNQLGSKFLLGLFLFGLLFIPGRIVQLFKKNKMKINKKIIFFNTNICGLFLCQL